jgi:hypothetical protein
MKARKLWAISVLLFVSATSVAGQPSSRASKGWFHPRHSGPAASHYQDNHIVVKHPKPHHPRNTHRF